MDCGGSCNVACPTCSDASKNGDETGKFVICVVWLFLCCVARCIVCILLSEMHGNDIGVDCGGSCSACPTCSDLTKNGDETGRLLCRAFNQFISQ